MNYWNSIRIVSLWLLLAGCPTPIIWVYGDERREEAEHVLERMEHEIRDLEELIHRAKEHDNEGRIDRLQRQREELLHEREIMVHTIEQRENEAEERERHEHEERERHERDERERREQEARERLEHEERERHEHEERARERHRHEEHEVHRHHLELRALEIEIQNLELQLQKNQMEMEVLRHQAAARLAEFTMNRQALAVIVVQRIAGTAERPEHAAELLTGLMERTDDDATRRIIQLQLAQIWMEARRPERAREALSRLIASPDRGRPRDVERRRDPEPRRESEAIQRVRKVFNAHDKNRDEHVDFEEWVRMKEGEMTPDRLEREKRRFGEIAGDDGRIGLREFLRWQQRRERPEPRGRRAEEGEGERSIERRIIIERRGPETPSI